ncbi:DNA alkylation repair protein [Blastococcus xanthinilyticus]|uniref:3-methyladenine DNA glycosylase AlkD n=1 Tax=Blastococcus xanthinilyticus TaxID=1564164 RepID=A0A5S5CN51_9ACTN|nr:DNA alkylation repair protein [Blastococcus xanthinilyticus]TYP83821.1 3-methyladenine DNA glycosylase AlkD [Blastococcus xanthinilyticus]
MTADEVLARLRALAEPARLPGMARYGIATEHAWGVTVGELRAVAKETGRDRGLAAQLWDSGVHEARILASLLDDPALVDDAQFERWAAGFDSWDLCDQVCQNLLRYAPPAWAKAVEWTTRPEPLVKRAGFTLMAGLAVAEKRTDDERFAVLLAPLVAGADDDRPLVRKGASWALRAIGKRSAGLNRLALATAEQLRAGGAGARWVGTDALRELGSPAVRERLARRG